MTAWNTRVALLCMVGCSHPVPPDAAPGNRGTEISREIESTPAPAVQDLLPTIELEESASARGPAFGGTTPGFGHWISANGRFILIYRFDRDDDSSGAVEARFGQHGEPLGDRPHPTLFDLQDGVSVVYDDYLTADRTGRWLVMVEGQHLWLLDTRSGLREDLTLVGADPHPDQNACLPARQVTFEPLGRRMSYLAHNPDRLVVRDLEGGLLQEIPSEGGLLWRGMPDVMPGWYVLAEISADSDQDGHLGFPVQNTSCACRWCDRFAATYGFYGWSGDAFQFKMVDPQGRKLPLSGPLIPLEGSVVGDIDTGQLTRMDGSTLMLPGGCSRAWLVGGASNVILSCGDHSMLWWPETGRALSLDWLVGPAVGYDFVVADRARQGIHQVAVMASRADQSTPRLGRLAMEDGQLELGPPITDVGEPGRGTVVTARTASGIHALDIATGRNWHAPLPATEEPSGLVFRLSETEWGVLSPDSNLWFRTSTEPYLVTSQGCSVEATAGQTTLETGPWSLRCPVKK